MAWAVRLERGSAVRWVARWREPSGKQRGKVFDRRGDALSYARTMEEWKRGEAYIDPDRGRTTLKEFVEAEVLKVAACALCLPLEHRSEWGRGRRGFDHDPPWRSGPYLPSAAHESAGSVVRRSLGEIPAALPRTPPKARARSLVGPTGAALRRARVDRHRSHRDSRELRLGAAEGFPDVLDRNDEEDPT
jgi:hypothetical protein